MDEDAEPDAEEDVDNVDEDFYAPDSDSELAAAPAFGGGSESAACQPLAQATELATFVPHKLAELTHMGFQRPSRLPAA